MADLTNTEATLNGEADITWNDGSASQTIDFSVPDEKLVLIIDNGDDSDAQIKIQAGDFFQKSQGAITETVASGSAGVIVVESARVKDSDGELTLEILDTDGTEYTGTDITAIKIGVIELP